MLRIRKLLLGGLLTTLFLVACSGSDSPSGVDDAGDGGAAWDLGATVGTVLGPFPLPGSTGEQARKDSWVSAVLPSGDPVEAFSSVVAEAEERGFEAFAESSGACRVSWGREEVPFDVESGTGDELGFGGDIAVDEPLPEGATVEGVRCRAVITRGDESVLVSVAAQSSSTAEYPSRTAVLLTSVVGGSPDADFEPVAGMVDVLARVDGPPTEVESRVVGATAADAPGLVVLDISVPGGLECRAGATDSGLPARAAVLDAFEKALSTYPADLRPDPEVVMSTIGDWPAATAVATVPADGPTVYAMVTETDTESRQLFCRVQY